MLEMVEEFHRKYELEYKGPPRNLPEELSMFRRRFIQEELDEYHVSILNQDLPGQLDALVDLLYVVLGTAHLHGFPIREAFAAVHAANMKKVRALRSTDSKRGSTYDVVKPEGWTAPDMQQVLDAFSVSSEEQAV